MLALPDRSYVLRIRGLLQVDGRFFLKSDTSRRMTRSSSVASVLRSKGPCSRSPIFDFSRSLPAPSDSRRVPRPPPARVASLAVGKYKAPSDSNGCRTTPTALLERGLDQNLTSPRDVGVQVWGDVAGGIVEYAGVFNGAADTTSDNTDLNHGKDVQGGCSSAVQDRGAEGFRQPGRRDLGRTGNRKGRLPTATAGRTDGSVAVQDVGIRTRSSSTWRRRRTPRARRPSSPTSAQHTSTLSSTTTTAPSACSRSTSGSNRASRRATPPPS